MADWTSEISSFKKFATSLQKFGEVGQKRINVVHTACVYCPYASAPYAFYMIFLNMREKAKTTCIGVDMHVWWSLARQIMF
nr:hypothetical protein [Tanacetum cinerariifolium]